MTSHHSPGIGCEPEERRPVPVESGTGKMFAFWTAVSILVLLVSVAAATTFPHEDVRGGTSEVAETTPVSPGLVGSPASWHSAQGEGVTADRTVRLVAGSSALPAVMRHCSNVTCNFYFSKSETARIQQQIDTNGYRATAMSGLICSATGPGAPACAAGLAIHAGAIQKNVKDAVGRRGCFVLRFNAIGAALGAASPAALSFYNVAGNHRRCGS
jgi:hypothetical protein